MKHCYGIFFFLLCTIALPIFPQPNSHYPDSSIQYPVYQPKVGIQRPDYRNHLNIPEYDPSLMPLKTVRTGTGVWTELNPKVPRVDYIGIDFINPDTGWAVGHSGAVIKTTNGGLSWETLQTPTTEILLKVHSYNGRIVMVVGQNGIILRSSDGGESFVSLSGVTTSELWGVKMLNDTLGWICGTNQTLLKTTDAGLTWQPVSTGFPNHYWSFDFIPAPSGDENYFMIVCSGGKVLKTTNGGISWTENQAGNTESLYTIDIIDSLHIAAAGNYGKNVYSSDGGVTWITSPWATSWPVNWIQYVNRDTGYMILSEFGSLSKTTDRGQTWVASGGGGWWQIELLEDGTGYCGGQGLNIYKRTNGADNWAKLFLNVDFRDVFFFNETTGFALSWELYKTTDGGISWEKNPNAPGGYDILFLDSLTGFIGGTERLFKTTNGGETWYEPNGIPTGIGHVNKIFFINSLIGWAVKSGNIIKTTDRGENWFIQIQSGDSFTSVFFLDTLNGWATSRYIWQTTNGGNNWIQRTDVPAFMSSDVHFINEKGYIISYFSQKLYKSTDTGSSWITQINSPYVIKYFGWLSNQHGLIMGGSVVYETIDEGENWNLVNELTNVGLQKFSAPNAQLGYSVGTRGLIYRYIDTLIVPIELTLFEGKYYNNKVFLNWQTASELNNRGFEIQKSSDFISWEEIGFVQGMGTTSEIHNYSYLDENIKDEINYYRLKQIDLSGSFDYSQSIKIILPIEEFKLFQNFPNPFNYSTVMHFAVPFNSLVEINLYEITGRRVETIVNKEYKRGYYSIAIKSNELSSGIYFYRMTTDKGYSAIKKLIILK